MSVKQLTGQCPVLFDRPFVSEKFHRATQKWG